MLRFDFVIVSFGFAMPMHNRTATRGWVSDSEQKINKSQDDICFAPLSKTSGHTTTALVQPNEQHVL